ncbi:MAG: tetratricopeptide repeat protein [Planctomycetota bacterium]|jgi:tetratricopeptide (TPR) repeat protein
MFKKALFGCLVLLGLSFFLLASGQSEDISAQLEQAEEYVEDGYYEQAEGIYKSIIAENPDSIYAQDAQRGLALLYLFADKPEKAESIYQQNLMTFSPETSTPKAVIQMAEICMLLDKYDRALELYEYILGRWPDGEHAIWAQTAVAVLNITQGNHSGAQAAIDKLFTDFFEHEQISAAAAEIADIYLESKEYEKSHELYQHVIEDWTDSEVAVHAQAGLAILKIGLSDDPNAEAAIEKLLTEYSENNDIAGAVHEVGDSYLESGQYAKANELYQYVIENWTDSEVAVHAQAGLAISNIGLGDDPNTEAAIEKLLTEYSDNNDIVGEVFKIAETYVDVHQYENACELFQYVIENWQDSEDIIHAKADLAKCYIAVGDDPNAHEAIDSLITDFNDYLELADVLLDVADEYHVKAFQMKYQGLDDKAREYFATAIDVLDKVITELPESSSTAEAYFFLAVYNHRLSQYENAINYFQKLLSDWPSYKFADKAQFLIGNCYEALRDTGSLGGSEANPEIERAYRLVVEKYPDSTSVRDASLKLGWLNFKIGQWLEAVEYWELTLQKSPENKRPIHILYPLGRAYEETQQFDKAIQVYKDFIKAVPSFDPRVEKVKTRLEGLKEF